MKRFWETVSIQPEAGGFNIRLDGRPMRLPGGAALLVHSKPLALAIAEEWQKAGGSRGGEMSFVDTPLTRLAGTAQERILPNPDPTIDAIARYGESDLLCYRSVSPVELARRQEEAWQPWLDWAAETYGARLRITNGVIYVRQHHDSVNALKCAVAAQDAYALAGLGIAVPALGSLVLGLALAHGALEANLAVDLGSLDEVFQTELWGDDDDLARRRIAVRVDVTLAARFMALSRGVEA